MKKEREKGCIAINAYTQAKQYVRSKRLEKKHLVQSNKRVLVLCCENETQNMANTGKWRVAGKRKSLTNLKRYEYGENLVIFIAKIIYGLV